MPVSGRWWVFCWVLHVDTCTLNQSKQAVVYIQHQPVLPSARLCMCVCMCVILWRRSPCHCKDFVSTSPWERVPFTVVGRFCRDHGPIATWQLWAETAVEMFSTQCKNKQRLWWLPRTAELCGILETLVCFLVSIAKSWCYYMQSQYEHHFWFLTTLL